MSEFNKKEHNGTKNFSHKVSPAKVKARTRYPVLQGIPIRGKVTFLGDDEVYFEDNDPQPHTRNKVVYRSQHFSARITVDGGFSITCHTTCEKMVSTNGKKKLIQEFLQMMTQMKDTSMQTLKEGEENGSEE